MNFNVEFSKNKVPCLWEKGGSKSEKEGYARIITGRYGQPKMPLHIKPNFYNQSDESALIPATKDSHIVEVMRHSNGYDINIYQIENIEGNQAQTKLLHSYNNKEWNNEPSMIFYDAIESGMKKTKDKKTFAPYFVML